MSTQILVNLPVKYLQQSIEFFTKLGFQFNPQFTDETATCMIVSETIFVVLLTHEKFKTFTPNPICDATKSTEVLTCLSVESREKVDQLVCEAVAAGGTTYNEPQDHGFMYAHGFQDLDGHIWELIYMEPEATHPVEAEREGQGEMPGCGSVTTLMTLGYDPQKQGYVGTWIGSMMTYLWQYDGELDTGETMLTLNSDGPAMTDDEKIGKYNYC